MMNGTKLTLCVVSILLSGAAGVLAQQGGQCMPHGRPGEGLGIPRAIDFDASLLVDEVLLTIPTDSLRLWVVDQFALDVTITSIDGGNHFHGSDIVPLSATTPFSTEGDSTDVVVAWTAEDRSERFA